MDTERYRVCVYGESEEEKTFLLLTTDRCGLMQAYRCSGVCGPINHTHTQINKRSHTLVHTHTRAHTCLIRHSREKKTLNCLMFNSN